MQVIKTPEGTFNLVAETSADQEFVTAMGKCQAPVVLDFTDRASEMVASDDNYWAVGHAVVQARIAQQIAESLTQAAKEAAVALETI